MKQGFLLVCLLMVMDFAGAQPRLLVDKDSYDFGQIEWKKPVTVEYQVTNRGTKPLVISYVEPSCACSVVDWPRTSIAPNEKAVITATFDAKALGHFYKSIGVYSNAQEELVYLYFSGEVVREITDFSHILPYRYGDILTDCNEIAFGDVSQGNTPQLTFNLANMSTSQYRPVLMHLPEYLTMEADPEVLPTGKKAQVTLTLNSNNVKDYGLTQTTVYLSRYRGDKIGEDNGIPVSLVVLPDFSSLSAKDSINAPAIRLSETNIDLGMSLIKQSKANYSILIANAGKQPLRIHKIQVFDPAVSVSMKKKVLEPDGLTKLKFKVKKRTASTDKHNLRILMITNDPLRPKIEINISR